MTFVLSKNEIQNVQEEVEDQVGGAFDLRTQYSGRGMFGEKCLGIVTNSNDKLVTVTFVEVLAQKLGNKLGADRSTLLRKMKEDNMGLSKIAYWENIRVEE